MIKMTNVKITVIKKFHSKDVFGDNFVHPYGNAAKEQKHCDRETFTEPGRDHRMEN